MSFVAVLGGGGALGKAVVQAFKQQVPAGRVVSLDFVRCPFADHSFVIPTDRSWQSQSNQMLKFLRDFAHKHSNQGAEPSQQPDLSQQQATPLYDTIVCTAGGWAGGDIDSPTIFDSVDKMISLNVRPSVTACYLSSHLLKPQGFVALTGAYTGGTASPGMAAYGMSKAAVHHLVQTSSVQGLPERARIVGVLPVTIETPGNRQAMPDADTSQWTKPEEIAHQLVQWSGMIEGASDLPPSGSLMSFVTQNNTTKIERLVSEYRRL